MDDMRQTIVRKTRRAIARNEGESAEEALLSATAEFLDERIRDVLNKKRETLIDLNRRVEVIQYIRTNFADDPSLGLESELTGVNRDISESRLSADSEQTHLAGHYLAGITADFKEAGVWDQWMRHVYEVETMEVLERLGDPQADLSKFPNDAIKMAQVVRKWQDISWADGNDAGASVPKDPFYIMRNSHDMFLIRDAAKRLTKRGSNKPLENRAAWIDFHMPLLNRAETAARFDVDIDELPRVMEQAYDALWSGVHLTNAAPGEAASVPLNTKNIAKKMSQQRMFVYNNAKDMHTYNQKFGQGSLKDTVFRGLTMSANQTGIMRVFGVNARNNFEIIFRAVEKMAAKQDDGGVARELVRKNAKRLDDIWKQLDGSVNISGDVILAKVGANIRTIQVMSKLGFSTLSAISDVPLAAIGLHHNGIGFLEGFADIFKSIGKAFDSSAERFEAASMMGIAHDGIRGSVYTRVSGSDAISGRRARLLTLYFKWNFLTVWTDAIREGVGNALSHGLALKRVQTLSAVNPRLVRTLKFYGIEDLEWNAARSMDTRDINGIGYVDPDAVGGIDDALIDPLIGDRLSDLKTRHADIIERDLKANERDQGFIDKRTKGFSDDVAKAKEDLDALKEAFAGRQDDLATEIRSRIARLGDEFQRAEVVSDIESFVVSERNRGRVRDLLERIEEGGDLDGPGVGISELAARESDKFSQTRGNQGERLGARRARTERRISQATQKEKRVSKELAGRLSKRELELVRRLEKKAAAFDEFVARADERMAKRRERAVELDKIFGRRVKRLRDNEKQLLQRKLRSYYQDQVDYSVVVPDAKTNAFLNRGTDPGSPEGFMLRLMTQFKTFSVAVLQRPVARELFAQGFSGPRRGLGKDFIKALGSGNGEWQGLAQLIAFTTVSGFISMSAKDIAKGLTPRDPREFKTWFAAAAQGGGFGIYGDFLFGEVRNRFGQSGIETALGPTAGSAADLLDLWGRFREGDDTAASTFNFILNHIPFSNLFYFRMAMDFLILHRIREGMNPGYLPRMERRIENENNQRFLVSPSSVIPRGGGTIGGVSEAVADTLNVVSSFGGED